MTNITIVIPHYNVDSYRERNINYCVRYYRSLFPDTPILVVEQNSKTDLDGVTKHIVVNTHEKFHKAKLLNHVVTNYVTTEYIALLDNDCIVPSQAFGDYESVLESNSVYLPYSSINYLNEGHTRIFVKNLIYQDFKTKSQSMSIDKYTGGLVICKKSTYVGVGGIDEYFVGWGGEDDAFLVKCKRKFGSVARGSNTEMVHLYHCPFHRNNHFTNDVFVSNKKAVMCLMKMTDDEFSSYVSSEDRVNLFKRLLDKYEKLNKLHVIVTAKFDGGSIKFDSTEYDIPCNSDAEAPIDQVLDLMLKQDGIERCNMIIRSILNTFVDLPNHERIRFQKYTTDVIPLL